MKDRGPERGVGDRETDRDQRDTERQTEIRETQRDTESPETPEAPEMGGGKYVNLLCEREFRRDSKTFGVFKIGQSSEISFEDPSMFTSVLVTDGQAAEEGVKAVFKAVFRSSEHDGIEYFEAPHREIVPLMMAAVMPFVDRQ